MHYGFRVYVTGVMLNSPCTGSSGGGDFKHILPESPSQELSMRSVRGPLSTSNKINQFHAILLDTILTNGAGRKLSADALTMSKCIIYLEILLY